MELQIEIDTKERRLAFDLVNTPNSLKAGSTAELPGGAVLIFRGLEMQKALDFPETIELALSFGSGVASSLVASWLYDKIRGRASKLRIERTEVQIDEGEIKRIIMEKIEKES